MTSQTGQENRECDGDEDEEGDSEQIKDPFDPLLCEIARDSHTFSGDSRTVSILPAEGDIIDGKFKIDRCLGTGGMGAVFSATHLVTEKRVAIKWMLPAQSIKPEAVHRFIREAQAAGRIDHPNVVDVYDFGKHESGSYLVMELLHGEPLSARLQGNYAYPYAKAIKLLMPVMRGVAAAHAAGVVHRDLKPANIFLCQGADGSSREPKVLDFGISKLLPQPGQLEPFETTDSIFLGTPSYTAPERLRANKTIDCRADLYALGVILYELIAGRPPFVARGFSELLVEIATGAADPLIMHRPEVPAELNDVVMKAMAREPDQRYPNVRSLALALEPFAEGVKFAAAGGASTLSPNAIAVIKNIRPVNLWIAASLMAAVAAALTISAAPKRRAEQPGLTKPVTSIQAVRAAQALKPNRAVVDNERVASLPVAAPRLQKASIPVQRPPDSKALSTPATKRAKSETSVKPVRKAAVPTREVSFINSRRAVVHITLKCPEAALKIVLPAKAKTPFPVPKQNCRMTCQGAGEPVCPITFRSDTDSLTIF